MVNFGPQTDKSRTVIQTHPKSTFPVLKSYVLNGELLKILQH